MKADQILLRFDQGQKHVTWSIFHHDKNDFPDDDVEEKCRGGLVFKVHRLCVSLNSRIESSKEEERECRAS